MPFHLLRSETLLAGRVFKIRRDSVTTPNGREVKLDVIEHGGSVVIVPLDAAGNLVFVRQYRHATGQDILELPAGTLSADEAPEDCARRELREETGFAAIDLEQIGAFFLAPGYSTEFMTVFLARGLTHDPLPADEDEFLQVEKVPLARAMEMARAGQILDAKSLAALFLSSPFVGK